MKKILILSFFVFSIALSSCSGSSDTGNNGSEGGEPTGPAAPSAAKLTKPENNSECLEVEAVKFEWNKSNDTTSYTIVIKNLLSFEIKSQTTTSNSAEITLNKGNPYSWYIISTNTSSATATSDKWKFYLSGEAQKNHAPFPADILAPRPGETVNAGAIQLSWSFSDVDSSDTHSFDVYLDTKDGSSVNTSNHTYSKKIVNLSNPGTYYWKIVTKDNHGSTSDSGVSTFIVIE